MNRSLRNLMLSLVVAGSLPVFGCTQQPAPSGPSPAVSKAAPPSASPASPSPSAVAKGPSPSPAATTSPAAASPSATVAGSSPAAPKGPITYTRKEYPAAGVEFDVPSDFSKFEEVGGWLAAGSDTTKIAVFVRSQEWKEWDDVLKVCEDTFKEFKASDDKVEKGKTSDGIEVWYDYGTAKVKDKPAFVAIAGYILQEHDFVLVVLADPDDPNVKDIAIHIFNSVTRQSKFQSPEGGEKTE